MNFGSLHVAKEDSLRHYGPGAGAGNQLLRYRRCLRPIRPAPALTEEIVGEWFAQGGGRRDAVVLATKVFNPVSRKEFLPEPNRDIRSLSAYKISKHCDGSLERLRTDRIDIYQMHHVDRECPWEETWTAFGSLIGQGKVVYVGSSNFAGWDIATACQEAAWRRYARLGQRTEHLSPGQPRH